MFTCRIAAALSLLATMAPAEEPVTKLPPEGAWVRYHGVTKPDDGPEAIYKSTIKMLRREDWNGRPCRWIEVEETGDLEFRQVTEYLIPETALAESERPIDEVVRAIHRNAQGEIYSESLEFNGVGAIDLLFCPAMRKNAKIIHEPQIVEYQSGKLTIPTGLQGSYNWTRESKTIKQTQSWTWEYTVWIDPKVPLGIALKKMTLTRQIDGVTTKTWTQDQYLEDFGLDAKPAFAK